MGPVSLALRAPFVAAGPDPGDDLRGAYRLGVLACLLAVAALAVVTARSARLMGAPAWLAAAMVGFWMLNPGTRRALTFGHPEEVLAAALALAAFAAALRDRAVAAGLLAGLALATKQWALLAVPALLLAVPAGARVRLALVAAGSAIALHLPMLVGDPARFADAVRDVAADRAFASPTSVWWPLARADRTDPPELLVTLAHPLVLVIALLLTAVAARRRRPAVDVLALVALIMLLRCVLDLYTFSYHHVPFLLAAALLAALRPRWIALPVAGAVAVWATSELAPRVSFDVLWLVYLTWSLPLCAWLAVSVLRRAGTRSP